MDKKLKNKWIKALRSGDYKQGVNYLKIEDRYCCLGVLADIQGCDPDQIEGLASSVLPKGYNAGIKGNTRANLAKMNDDGRTFNQIADYIKENFA